MAKRGTQMFLAGALVLLPACTFTEDALKAVAQEAYRRKSGARGLRAILEEVMLDVMYEIPSMTGVTECSVTRAVVENRERPELVRDETKAAG